MATSNDTTDSIPLAFRAPSTSQTPSQSQTAPFQAPSPTFLTGPWHVTHSTLPMWKNNKNVVITYTPLTSPPGAIDDLVTYQPLNSDKQKTVKGIDKPDPTVPAAYDWRGKGWLKVASSHWEVLAHGEEEGGWVVTYFAKTLFTPAGIDVYARERGGLSERLIGRIKEAMSRVEDAEFRKLVGEVFVIKHEW